MPRVAIVIVTWNSAAEIGGCLDALTALREGDAETIVVDNASADSTRAEVASRHVRLIANAENKGFAAAVNQGVLATSAPLILLLNPDAHVCGGLDVLMGRFDDSSTGAAGGLLLDPMGNPQTGFMARNLPTPATLIYEVLGLNRLWPNNPINWHYRCKGLNPMTAALVDQPAGAFLMFRRDVWRAVGGFDEKFHPIWFEDVDFCAQIKERGYRIWFEPAARAKHTGSHSIQALTLEMRQGYWYGSLLRYAGKHYRSVSFRTVCLAVAAGAVFRAVWGIPREGRDALAVFGNIAGHALGRLFRRREEIPVFSDRA